VLAALVGHVVEGDGLDEGRGIGRHVVDREFARGAEMRVEALHVLGADGDADRCRRRPGFRFLFLFD
jgi:hypothetical protein